jgi:glycerophosphoryl diester phosphodiesterase
MRSSPSRAADGAGERLEELIALPFAHRGLHGGGIVENSRAAFAAAIARGHGIELDVQASRDGDAFVFHDQSCDRLTLATGPIAARGSAELSRLELRGAGERLAALPEVLALIAGRVPLLIEVKTARDVAPLCRSVADALADYRGAAGVMSFDPRVGAWFARHAPHRLRGLVVTERNRKNLRGQIARRLALARARPHFLGYDIRDLPSPFAAAARARGIAVCTWTVRTAAERARAAEHADQIIYEE